jgi:hypothetical protein
MQTERLMNYPPEKERYFEPSEKENMFNVFQRTLDKSLMMYRTFHIGTFSKEVAIKKIKFIEELDFEQCDLSNIKNDLDINRPQEKLNVSFEPVSNLILNESIEEKSEKEIEINSLSWQFLEEKAEKEDIAKSKYDTVACKSNNKRHFRGLL